MVCSSQTLLLSPCCASMWADLGVSLKLIMVALHFKRAQILTALGGEKLRLYPLMRKLCLSCHCEIVSVSMNLDENLCIRGDAERQEFPTHLLTTR